MSIFKPEQQPDNRPAASQQINDSLQLPAQAITALSHGHKIEAIKIVHRHTGLGLKDSKQLVEAYELQHPQLSSASTGIGIKASSSRHGLAISILVLLLLALMLALIFF